MQAIIDRPDNIYYSLSVSLSLLCDRKLPFLSLVEMLGNKSVSDLWFLSVGF